MSPRLSWLRALVLIMCFGLHWQVTATLCPPPPTVLRLGDPYFFRLNNCSIIPGNVDVARDLIATHEYYQFDLGRVTTILGRLELRSLGQIRGSIKLTTLETVRGDCIIIQNDRVDSLDISKLTTVTGILSIQDNPALEYVHFSQRGALISVGALSFTNCPKAGFLTGWGFDIVAHDFTMINTGVAVLRVYNMSYIGGAVKVNLNDKLEGAEFPDLVSVQGAFDISNNAALVHLEISQLRSASPFIMWPARTADIYVNQKFGEVLENTPFIGNRMRIHKPPVSQSAAPTKPGLLVCLMLIGLAMCSRV